MFKRLPLRVKGPPQETYMVASPKTFMVAPLSILTQITWTASLSPSSKCQKVKHCFTFIVYNDAHYHISSLLLSSKTERGTNKQRWPMYRAETDLGKEIYNQREKEEENRRERTSYIDYLYVTSLLCNPVLRRTGGTKLVITQLNAGIIEKFIASSPGPYLLC